MKTKARANVLQDRDILKIPTQILTLVNFINSKLVSQNIKSL